MDTQILAVEHLNKCFGQAEILHDVDFSVSRGDVYGLVGQNGAGKTTLLRLIAGLMKPTKGNILCYMEKDYIGYMPQSCRFDGAQTVASTIQFFSALRNADMQNGLRLCQKLELDTAKRVKNLSPGQQKKLQMVITMTGDPDFYILDEPTAGLDPNASHEMNKLIQELHQQGKSILISSHILQDMDDICTNVAIMESGRLIYDRQLESSYIIETSIVPDKLFTQLAQKFSLSSNQERTLIHAKTDREGVAALIGALTANSVLVYEAVHSNVKDVVQEQLHMNN
ncbi:ABC transporter ATP-binding protein [uncultured Phocaeicola sp.]|uniref:ABC transporter ATP-binding protein n=1 Tax=uncultured Phocaeicola sp. TaxID=990718 RepID=UPI0026331CC2|nr:ABC transporter ATP-binding protein [uncultured Phocaeicola sp.]